MGVHQFLSWLRARHPQAFRTSRKLRSVEEETFKREFFNNNNNNNSHREEESDSDDDSENSSSSREGSSSSSDNNNQQNQAKKKKRTLSGSEDDYAVICLDINALLHEVATAVTTQNQQQTPGVSSSGTSKIQLLNKGTVEQEILIRLRKQIEDLIFVAGGDTLKLQQQQHSNNKKIFDQNNNNNSNNFGVLTFDNLEETVSQFTTNNSNSNEPIKNANFNGHNFKLFEQKQQQGNNDEDSAASANDKGQTPLGIEEQNLLPVDILLVIDGVAPIGKCPQQRERRATRKQPGTVQEKAQQLLIQAAEKRAGRLDNIFSSSDERKSNQHNNRHRGGNNNNNQNGLDEEITHSSTAFSLYAGDMSSNSTTLASGASSVWDGNAITVGTPFMQQVCALLHYVGGALVKLYRNLRVFVSDATVPGEGEQKIFSALRSGMLSTVPLSYTTTTTSSNSSSSNNKVQNTIKNDENRRICVCSNDTDSIVMALLLTDEDLVKRPIDVWRTPSIQLYNLAAATAMQLVQQQQTTTTAVNSSSSSLAAFQQQQQNATAWIFDMNIFIQEMKKAFDWPLSADNNNNFEDLEMKDKKKTTGTASNSSNSSFVEIRKRTFGGAMKSFAFMLSLFGGDFLPRVSDLSIADGDLDDVIEVLSEELFVKDKWIVDPLSGIINLQSMYLVLQSLNERKYGVQVVEKSNNTSNTESGARRARPGGSSSSSGAAAFSLILGGGDAFNPFASTNNNNKNNSTNSNNAVEISTDPAPRQLVSFWEGIVWVGRYFDGVIISWSWFFEAGAGTITSAFNTHHSAPKLKDLVKYPHAYMGRPVEMAATAAKMFQDQVEIYQRGLGGQFLATKQRHYSHQQLNNSSIIPSPNACRNISATQASAAVAKILQRQQDSDCFADVNTVAFAAVVLPYYSWANLLPRALGEELLAAYDRVRSQTLEEEKKEQDRDDADPHFLAEEEKLLDLTSDYAATGSVAEVEEKNAKLAKLFIRQQRNLKGFNPVKAVSAVMKLVINLRGKFSQEEQKLLNKKDMYKLAWARVVGSDNKNKNTKNNNQQRLPENFEVGNLFTSSSDDAVSTLKQHENLFRQSLSEMNPSNSLVAKIWNEKILSGKDCLTVTDVFNLNLHQQQQKNNHNNEEDFACIFGNDDDNNSLETLVQNFVEENNSGVEIPNLENFTKIFIAAESLGKEHLKKLMSNMMISSKNKINNAEDAAPSPAKKDDKSRDNNNNNLASRVGSIFIPSSVKFAGIYSHHGSASISSSALSASLLASFPTLANSFVPASQGGVAVLLQEIVSVI